MLLSNASLNMEIWPRYLTLILPNKMDRYDGVNDQCFNANYPNFNANSPSRRKEFPHVEGRQNQWRAVGVTGSQPEDVYGGFNGQQHTSHMPFERNAQQVSSPITLVPGMYKCS
ncbi:hypothetical protein O181_082965 [Austropuccinia psidii MF-1]|uniref:Uncharacterized protein n=1 Tax=Austropuccinia psidii MF-1 TaxID=1389203 RepID=A0A9Q3ILA4_9BASI|nr:hypothetical protein [Austropuccinia psidii MF-1]